MQRAVISVSGGMDSTGLLLNLLREGYKVDAISFNYGQKHSVEIERLNKNIDYLKSNGYNVELKNLDLSQVMKSFNSSLIDESLDVPSGVYDSENMKSTVVPNRNAIFSAITYGYALSISTKENCNVDIALGVHSGDHTIYPDCREDFFTALNYAFKIGNWGSEKVGYYLPYMKENKFFILKDAKISCEKLNLDFTTVFKNTNTCYNPSKDGKSCGKCGSCNERLEAFLFLGEKDPVEYLGV